MFHHLFQVRHDKLVGFSNLSRYSSKEVATFVVDLLPSLCEHLEATSAFFQVFAAADDFIPVCNTC